MYRIPFFIGCFVVLHATAPAQDASDLSVKDRGEAILQALKQAKEAVAAVKDSGSADAAKAKLMTLEQSVRKLAERKPSPTPDEAKWLKDEFEPKKLAGEFELEKARDNLFTSDVKLYARVDNADAFKEMRAAKIKRAELMAQNIQKACKAYYLSTDDGWPKSLDDLTGAKGGRAYLEGGKKAIQDPWAREFTLRIETTKDGDDVPVISTIAPYGDGKLEIRWPAKGK